MEKNVIEKLLSKRFISNEVFARNELFDFYRNYEPEMNEQTFAWRIFDLKRRHIIVPIKKGLYQLAGKKEFQPSLSKNIIAFGKIMDTSFDDHIYNIWSTDWLNEFIELQAITSITILEVEKSLVESVFYKIKDKGYKNIFFKPDGNVIEKYVSELKYSIIIKSMVTRAPTITIEKVILPTLEKILVDLYCDGKIFFPFQGNQLIKIYESAIENYSINYSKMFNYARRRKREKALKEFLLNNLYEKIKDMVE